MNIEWRQDGETAEGEKNNDTAFDNELIFTYVSFAYELFFLGYLPCFY
jgi:hypothetical protein